jgi:hypothetical protein
MGNANLLPNDKREKLTAEKSKEVRATIKQIYNEMRDRDVEPTMARTTCRDALQQAYNIVTNDCLVHEKDREEKKKAKDRH